MGIDAVVFFSSGGGVGATVEAARGRPVGPCGWARPAGRPRPSGGGEGKSVGKKKKKRETGPKGQVGRK
jgi:hypothetical protein